MEVIFILIIISLLVAGGFLVVFILTVRSGQYEDTYTPSVRILLDDDPLDGSSVDIESTPDKHTITKTTDNVRTN